MGLTIFDIQTMTNDWQDRAEQRVLDDLYRSAESAVRLTLAQAVYRHLAAQLATDIEAHLEAARADLEEKTHSANEAAAKVGTIEADLEVARTALEAVGRPGQAGDRERAISPERRALTRLTKAHREAGEELRRLKRERATVERKVAGMGRVMTALRDVGKPDRAIVRALADALANVGEW